jgi:hypothetical protein
MIDRIARAVGLAIALAGATGATANAQQSSAGTVASTHQPQDTTHRTAEPSPAAADSQKSTVATTSISTGHGHGLMKRATAAAASAAKTVTSAGTKEDAAEAALLAVGKANPGTLMLEEVLRAQQRDRARAAASQATRQANADAAMATATAQMSAGMAAVAQQLASAGPSVAGPAGSVESDPELAATRTAYMQLATRAASGDRKAADQLTRFQREMSVAALGINALPASQQQRAYGVALRDALACATSGKGCRAR